VDGFNQEIYESFSFSLLPLAALGCGWAHLLFSSCCSVSLFQCTFKHINSRL